MFFFCQLLAIFVFLCEQQRGSPLLTILEHKQYAYIGLPLQTTEDQPYSNETQSRKGKCRPGFLTDMSSQENPVIRVMVLPEASGIFQELIAVNEPGRHLIFLYEFLYSIWPKPKVGSVTVSASWRGGGGGGGGVFLLVNLLRIGTS